MEKTKILIVDDHEIIHNGIKDILKSSIQYEIAGYAFNGRQAIEVALLIRPDIIFMDISMPEMNGIDATREIKKQLPGIKIIALTQHEEMEYVYQSLKAGGDGYLLKNSKREEFIEAIETVLRNRKYLSPEIEEQVIIMGSDKNDARNEDDIPHLTRREIEIIQKIAEDKSNFEIADELNISLRTVETHRRNLMQKLKVNSVVALIKYAALHNLIDLKK